MKRDFLSPLRFFLFVSLIVALFPVLVSAATGQNVLDVLAIFGTILSRSLVLLVSLAVFMVVYGIFKFVVHADDEGERAKGRSAILWGVIGLFCIVSVWGLVNLIRFTLSLDSSAPSVPYIPTP